MNPFGVIDRRRLILAASGALATGGCLGLGETNGSNDGGSPAVRFVNETDGERRFTFRVRRPFDATPTGTRTTNTEGLLVITQTAVTVPAGSTRTLAEAFPDARRILVRAAIEADNGSGAFQGATSAIRRGDASALSPPMDVTVWYVEDSPYVDDDVASLADKKTFFDLRVEPIGSADG